MTAHPICWLIITRAALASLTPLRAYAEEALLWEAGIGMAYINIPYCRGSDERKLICCLRLIRYTGVIFCKLATSM
jgi:hypothetical protein